MNIRYLHLSDLHLTGQQSSGQSWAAEQFNQDLITRSMLEFIGEKLVKEERKTFDFIFITGDLAKRGMPDDYAVARVFCDRLLEATGVHPSRLFLVPGNHDVDRSKVDLHDLEFNTEDNVTAIVSSPEKYRALTRKFESFYEFAGQVMGRGVSGTTNCYFVEPVSISTNGNTVLVNVVGLNSALFAGYDGDDRQKLAFGLPQVSGARNLLSKEARLTMVMFHHPFSCFHAVDRVCRNLLMQQADLILTGHLHEPENMWVRGPSGQSIIIGAGASFETRESENSFNVVEIDPSNGAGKVQFYKYLPKHNRWKEDTDANPEDKQGIFPFEIKRLKPPDDVASANTGILLLKKLILKVPAVADAVSRSKEVVENAYRQMDRLKLLKKIHDALHTIEFDCLRNILASGAEANLGLPQWAFERQARQISEAIREGSLNFSSSADLLDQLDLTAKAFKSAVDPHANPAGKKAASEKVVSELINLLSLYPSMLDSEISNAARDLKLDRLVELMTEALKLLPAGPAGQGMQLELFPKGIDAFKRLRDELAGRISEHTRLQSLDSKLRTVCIENTPRVTEEWGRIKRLRSRLAPPFSPEMSAMNDDLIALESEIDSTLRQEDEKAALNLLKAQYSWSVSYTFKKVDGDLKEFCLRLSGASDQLKRILEMC